MAALTLTLGDLVNRVQLDILDTGGQGKRVVISQAITTSSQTTFTLADATGVNITDLIELGDELMLVTAKSSDPTPVITVARGYFHTVAGTYAINSVAYVNPRYPRVKIAEAVKRSFSRIDAMGVHLLKSSTVNRVADHAYTEMPVDCRDVLQVLYWGTDGRLLELTGWRYYDDLPVAKFSTRKALNLPNYIEDTDELEVVYRAAYRWSTYPDPPVAASTIQIAEGCEDLPVLYASALLVSNREISRMEIDRSEEWNQSAMTGQGQSTALVRAKWQEFYRALDEARRIPRIPTPIIFHRRPRF